MLLILEVCPFYSYLNCYCSQTNEDDDTLKDISPYHAFDASLKIQHVGNVVLNRIDKIYMYNIA